MAMSPIADKQRCQLAHLQGDFEGPQDFLNLHVRVANLKSFFGVDPVIDFLLSRDDRRVRSVPKVLPDL